MCLGIPGQVVEIVDGFGNQVALADVNGVRRQVNIAMLDEMPAAGDWILVHMGFAMEQIGEAEARETLAGLEMTEPDHRGA